MRWLDRWVVGNVEEMLRFGENRVCSGILGSMLTGMVVCMQSRWDSENSCKNTRDHAYLHSLLYAGEEGSQIFATLTTFIFSYCQETSS